MMATSEFQRSWVHIQSIIPRALRQRATHNIEMALGLDERGKLAHGRIQPALPMEFELIQTQTAQKPVLQAEVHARALRTESYQDAQINHHG